MDKLKRLLDERSVIKDKNGFGFSSIDLLLMIIKKILVFASIDYRPEGL